MPSTISRILEVAAEGKRQQQFKEFREAEAKSNTGKKTTRRKVAKKVVRKKAKKSAMQLEQERIKKEKMRKKAFKKRQAGLPKQKLRGIKTKSGLTIVRE